MRNILIVILFLFCNFRLGCSAKIRVLKFDPINEGIDKDNLQVEIGIDPRKNYSKVTKICLKNKLLYPHFNIIFV
jgi:hypothetical protein